MASRFGALAAVVVTALVAGCAISAPAVRTDEALAPTVAYAYGRFIIKAEPTTMGDVGRLEGQTIGLVLGCNDGATYPLLFRSERVVTVIKIQPASCALQEIEYVNPMGIIRRKQLPPPAWIHSTYFGAGHGYYLGDFFAIASHQPVQAGTLLHWDMDPVDGHFTETTAELREHFPALATLPLHDQRLAPERPPPKRGLAGANEPLMSPQRIARLAGFVKSTYPTPAACQAACRTGDCLPYRASSGAAITCIVHCTTNHDCPNNMACNCSRHAGPDCRSVAETSEDPMEGICMPVGPEPTPANPAGPRP